MKILFVIIILLMICPEHIFPQEEFFWQNPSPQGNHIREIISIDENNIVAGGVAGVFIKSTDSGLNWEISYLSENTLRIDLKYFSSVNYLFALAFDFSLGTLLYKSEDLGSSWDSIFTFNNLYLYDIDKNSEDVLYAVGDSGRIFKSSDNGYYWQSVSSPTTVTLSAIQFFDNQSACIVGDDGIILRTSDNGNTWSIIQSGIYENIYAIDFFDSMEGVIVGQRSYYPSGNSILKSTDGGITWTKKIVSYPLGELLDVEFIDMLNIIIVGGNDDYYGGREPIIIRSSDGGENWIELSSQFPRGLSSISFYNATNAFCAGYSGGIYKTNDAGNNWIKLSNNFYSSFSEICSFDSSYFYTIGLDHESNEVILLFTNDGGEVWESKSAPFFNNISGIDFINENYGMIAGDNSIFYTSDGCNTWNQGNTNSTTYFTDVKIINNNRAFISGGQGTLLKSSDGGITWTFINSGTTGTLERIIFKDSLNGLIIVNGGPSLLTVNGGESWNIINYNFGQLRDGTFFGNNNIALSGSNGKIYLSNDAGQTWIVKIVAASGTYISGLFFKDSMNGLAVGEKGLILYTTDGGDTWIQQFSPTLIDFYGIKYSENKNVVVIGKEGVILGSKKGIIPVSVDDHRIHPFINNFHLQQNYPNPFNPSTKIIYSIPESGRVVLSVFNILGEEIVRLVDEEKVAGKYEVEFDASGLSSGIYLYKLNSNVFVQIKKMLFIK